MPILDTRNKAGSTTKVARINNDIAIVSNNPTEAAPLCGLNDNEKKVPIVVRALMSTALAVLDV